MSVKCTLRASGRGDLPENTSFVRCGREQWSPSGARDAKVTLGFVLILLTVNAQTESCYIAKQLFNLLHLCVRE